MTKRDRIAVQFCVLMLVLSGCSSSSHEPSSRQQPTEQNAPAASGQDHWVAGSESSMVLAESTPKSASITRCWPENGGYDCLDVGGLTGLETDLARYWTQKLPTVDDYHASGYRCKYSDSWGNVEETISRDGATLVGHTYGGGNGGRSWTKKYAENFVKENAIPNPNRYFDCDRIVGIIRSGSLDSINSTVVTHNMLGG